MVASLIASGVLLLGSSGAPRPEPFQTWADRSKVPTAPVTIPVRYEACPGSYSSSCLFEAYCYSCTHPYPPNGLYIAPNPNWRKVRFNLMHELGHAFDKHQMTDANREEFKLLIRHQHRPWRQGPNSVHEKFAEAYGMCAWKVPNPHGRKTNGGYGYDVSFKLHRRICSFIKGIRSQ